MTSTSTSMSASASHTVQYHSGTVPSRAHVSWACLISGGYVTYIRWYLFVKNEATVVASRAWVIDVYHECNLTLSIKSPIATVQSCSSFKQRHSDPHTQQHRNCIAGSRFTGNLFQCGDGSVLYDQYAWELCGAAVQSAWCPLSYREVVQRSNVNACKWASPPVVQSVFSSYDQLLMKRYRKCVLPVRIDEESVVYILSSIKSASMWATNL